MTIRGFWFDPDSSARQQAHVQLTQGAYQLETDTGTIRNGSSEMLVVSDRLGDMPRRLTWPDGGLFETTENDAIDSWLSNSAHTGSRSVFLHKIESHWGWVATALIVTVLVTYLGVRFGLPAASESIARKLPVSVNETVSTQALNTLDRLLFAESTTSEEERAQVQRQFDELLSVLPDSEINFKLHFRSMNGVANAMALPGGDIVVTDAFLELVEHPQELESVLLHEIGHVVEYHGMTQVIRASAMSVIVTLAFGDLSALGEVAVGVPVFIMQNSYSQAAESEADNFAFEQMSKMGKDPGYFADIILRLGDQHLESDDESAERENRGGYFSSHPGTQSRARKAMEASRAMQQQ